MLYPLRCLPMLFISASVCALGFEVANGQELPFKQTIPDVASPWPTWIEGRDGVVLMAYTANGRIQITESTDGGRSWSVVSHVDHTSSYPYMTRLRDGQLAMVVANTSKEGLPELGWIASNDEGRTWSEFQAILIAESHIYPFGPLIEMPDGRWAYCPYRQVGEKMFQSLLTWSSDKGKTWSDPVAFPTPADGNKGLTESTVVQLGPKRYLAAIRADEGEEGAEAFDGFYLSRSTDGLNWSTPKPTGDIGRMPLFYRLGERWVLTYRQYAPTERASYGAYRISRDGLVWSEPHRIEKGVNNAPFLIRVGDELVAFNHGYPDRTRLTRHVIQLPDAP